MKVAGLILAGGQSRRMGTDKSFVELNSKPLIQHVIERARPQVSILAGNTNSDDPRYTALGLPLIQDIHTGFQGPLAGLHAGLTWLQSQKAEWLATFACDTPFVPEDCVGRLVSAAAENDSHCAVAAWKGRTPPTIGVWHLDLLDQVHSRLKDGDLKLMKFVDDLGASAGDFSDQPMDPFRNINSEEDLVSAETHLLENG